MQTRNRLAILFCIALLIPAAVAAQQLSKSPVTIRVTDNLCAVVPGAQVHLDPAPDPLPASMQTNQLGELALELKPGHYKLDVSFDHFRHFTAELGVPEYGNQALAASSQPQTVTVVLQLPPAGDWQCGPLPNCDPYPSIRFSLRPYHEDANLSLPDFGALPHKVISYYDAHTDTAGMYSGVPLSDLLAKYGVPLGKDLRGKALALYVVAAGSDNYKAVLSLAEIDPAFHPGDVIVADVMNGKPLDAASGPFKLVVTEDKRPARSVHNLVSLELRSAD